jgi:hypothetical protein
MLKIVGGRLQIRWLWFRLRLYRLKWRWRGVNPEGPL